MFQVVSMTSLTADATRYLTATRNWSFSPNILGQLKGRLGEIDVSYATLNIFTGSKEGSIIYPPPKLELVEEILHQLIW